MSVGIGPTKTLAKVANRQAKKDPASNGVCALLDEAAQTAALGRVELTDLWGVARRATPLRELGVRTPLDLRAADPRFMRRHFGVVMERLVRELRGTSCIDLEETPPERKTVVASRSFGRPVVVRREMDEAVAVYVARAAEKMRRQGLACAALLVFVETNRFKPGDPQYAASRATRLPVATADTGRLTAAALAALAVIWRPGFSYKKAGTVFLELVPASQVQGGLFDRFDDRRSLARMAAIDALNSRYGRGTVAFGTAGERQRWTLRRDFMSPRYRDHHTICSKSHANGPCR